MHEPKHSIMKGDLAKMGWMGVASNSGPVERGGSERPYSCGAIAAKLAVGGAA